MRARDLAAARLVGMTVLHGMRSDLAIFGGSACALLAFYAFGSAFFISRSRPLEEQRRRLSWLLTTFAALVVTVVGTRYAVAAWFWGVSSDVELYTPFRPMLYLADGTAALALPEEAVSRGLCLFFLAYCAVDTVVGAMQYPEQIDIGFLHHGFYAGLLSYLLYTRQTLLFAICGVEELSTLLVGLTQLLGVGDNPNFAVSIAFFLTRVSYHSFITVRAMDSLNPLLYWVSSVILIQHVSWFQAFVAKGTMPSKRRQPRAAGPPVNERALWELASRHLLTFVLITLGQALLSVYLTVSVLRAVSAAHTPASRHGASSHFGGWRQPALESKGGTGWVAWELWHQTAGSGGRGVTSASACGCRLLATCASAGHLRVISLPVRTLSAHPM